MGRFDVVLCAATLETVREPEKLLADVRSLLAPGGVLIGSTPNFGHWYPRIRTMFGLFDYDQRGVLSSAHVRFFTRRGLHYRFRAAGLKVAHEETAGSPIAALSHGTTSAAACCACLIGPWCRRPEVFGYQMVFMCEPSVAAATSARAAEQMDA